MLNVPKIHSLSIHSLPFDADPSAITTLQTHKNWHRRSFSTLIWIQIPPHHHWPFFSLVRNYPTRRPNYKYHRKNLILWVDQPLWNTRENNIWSRAPILKWTFPCIGQISWNTITTYHTQMDGLIGRQHRTLKVALKCPLEKSIYFTNCSTLTANGNERRFRVLCSRVNLQIFNLVPGKLFSSPPIVSHPDFVRKL